MNDEERQKKRYNRYVGLLLVATALIYAIFLYVAALGLIQVTVNDKTVSAGKDMTIGQLLKGLGQRIQSGNLLGLDGSVLDENGGRSSIILVNGHQARETDKPARGARIKFIPGRDIKEPVKIRFEIIPARVRMLGSGSFIKLIRGGVPGRRAIYYGARSGTVIASKVREAPMTAIFRRVSADPVAPPAKAVALTFDDGPSPQYTSKIMTILKTYQVTATFFAVGSQMAKYPDIVREIGANGHSVENHSFSHARMDQMPPPAVDGELDQTRALIFQLTNKEPKWFRPPFGRTNEVIAAELAPRGYRQVLWSVDTQDWREYNPDIVFQTFMTQVSPGAVVLMHDGGGNRDVTAAALPRIIQYLRDQGYAIVTLDELRGGG